MEIAGDCREPPGPAEAGNCRDPRKPETAEAAGSCRKPEYLFDEYVVCHMLHTAYTGMGYINYDFKKMLSKIIFIEILDNISDKTTNKRES